MTPLKIPEILSPGFFDSGLMRISDLRNRASNASDNFEFTSRGGFTRARRAQRSAYFCTNGFVIVVAFLFQLGLMRSEISDAPGDVSPLRYQSVLRPRLFFLFGGHHVILRHLPPRRKHSNKKEPCSSIERAEEELFTRDGG
jgi:hypothetical protein